MAARIKKGDTVVLLAGKDKGKRGQVTEVLTKLDKVIVEGVNSVITVSYTHLTLPTNA